VTPPTVAIRSMNLHTCNLSDVSVTFQILTQVIMNYSQNYWVYGLRPSSYILKTRQHNVSETDLFPSSGEGRDTCSLIEGSSF
jgi:hypothetical protein